VLRLPGAGSPPLGAGTGPIVEERLRLEPGDVLALYTDGLVERRDIDIDAGVDALASALAGLELPLRREAPDGLMAVLLPDGPDDDVALLLAQADESPSDATLCLPLGDDIAEVSAVRRRAADMLAEWGVRRETRDDALLLLSELTTNALLHGRGPREVRLGRDRRHLTLEVHDGAPTLPRPGLPGTDDEHGRGLLLVSLLAARWGTRPTPAGKAVWCVLELPQEWPAGR
jgi:anti-sigma regulatory factor (Ser/Thr protein kinase)